MEELVYTFLIKNFLMSYHSYLSGVVTDKLTKRHLTIIDLYQIIEKVFDVNSKIFVTKWWDQMEIPFIQEELKQGGNNDIR